MRDGCTVTEECSGGETLVSGECVCKIDYNSPRNISFRKGGVSELADVRYTEDTAIDTAIERAINFGVCSRAVNGVEQRASKEKRTLFPFRSFCKPVYSIRLCPAHSRTPKHSESLARLYGSANTQHLFIQARALASGRRAVFLHH